MNKTFNKHMFFIKKQHGEVYVDSLDSERFYSLVRTYILNKLVSDRDRFDFANEAYYLKQDNCGCVDGEMLLSMACDKGFLK